MITITTKNAPKQLVEKINAFIKNKRITTWDIDNENDYILNLDEYRYKAWMSIDDRIEGYTLHFCIIESRKYAMTKEIYAVYHTRFAEMLLEYFDTEIVKLQISPLLVDNYDKFKYTIINNCDIETFKKKLGVALNDILHVHNIY